MSKIEVNEIDKQGGSTLTLGGSGTAVTLACGATQSGFGRTGTVDWQTGSIKTTDFTAVNGQGFFVDTNGGAVTATLPTGSAGSIVSIQDYRNTFDTANCTVQTAGSQKINGGTAGGKVILSTEGEGITLVYIDSTIGWRSIQDNDFASSSAIPTFIAATGGTVSTVCTNFKVHTFTGPGTFCVSSVGNACGSNTVSYMVVAGGGSGGQGCTGGGAGGAGGYRESKAASDSYTASPLNATSGPTYNLPVTATGYPITVGGGGAAKSAGQAGGTGSDSIFSTITSAGGGGGGKWTPGGQSAGGSGGGSAQPGGTGGAGNTPSVSPPQGNPGGGLGYYQMGGGGGATTAGQNGNPAPSPATRTPTEGNGGTGATSSINGTPTERAGGGAGGFASGPAIPQGKATATGGGGTGGGQGSAAQAGTDNTGGGGGGGGAPNSDASGAGGSGIVIIRYKFQ